MVKFYESNFIHIQLLLTSTPITAKRDGFFRNKQTLTPIRC